MSGKDIDAARLHGLPESRPSLARKTADSARVLTGINHITLAVSDLARSIEFYREALELRLAARWKAGAYLTAGELWLCLSLDDRMSCGPRPDYTHYAFSISQSDFIAYVDRLRSRGIAEWKDNKSEGDSVYFLDPDGHKLEAHVGSLTTRLAQCRIRPYEDMEIFD